MLKLFNKKKKDNKGFTLVELVIVSCNSCNLSWITCTTIYKIC